MVVVARSASVSVSLIPAQSAADVTPQGNHLACGALFAVLLNLKHIYVYIALPYFVFLLRAYCFPPATASPAFSSSLAALDFVRLSKLGALVIGIFAVSLGPFYRDLGQIAQRLFPFGRGLNHAYWAANWWSIYTLADRVLLRCKPILFLWSRGALPLTVRLRRERAGLDCCA